MGCRWTRRPNTPARYLQKITVTTGGVTIFDLPAGDGAIDVLARDSGAAFSRQFEALPQS